MAKGVLCDANKCIGCRACQVACKQWNELPTMEMEKDGVLQERPKDWINSGTIENPPQLSADTFTKVRFREVEHDGKFHWVFAKIQCMHCEEPACVEACLVGALEKTKDGPVTYDDRKCIGCRYCMMACPFGVPTFEWEKRWPWIRKCTFCADRQGGGLEPACVTTCPTGALKFGEREDLIVEARERIAARPDEYVDYIYGEKEVGGTSWLYLSPIPFEKLDLPTLGTEKVTINPERAMGAVPPALVAVAALMAGIYWLTKRRQKLSQATPGDQEEKEEVTK
ncbi:MAG: 4Fe-4S dicluster domain-containing protein [Dehalococcoidia bacterium]|nr:4Fe-4S dicluster domain-containing protein [Dehalococcoidia bacterium]